MALPLSCQALSNRVPLSCQALSNGVRMTSRHIQCVAASTRKDDYNQTVNRRSANYSPSIWNHSFMESLNTSEDGLYEERIKKLDEKVKCMIDDDDADPLAQLELIDDIQRLGLRYRFEENIRRAFDKIFYSKMDHLRTEKSLHATALIFRLLRQDGYEVSQDVFERFKDHNGSFITCLSEDVKGMLNLYEASYLAFEGEGLLDEAKEFTAKYLKHCMNREASNISIQVSRAMELPLHRRMLRLEARTYIEAYEKREDANSMLLELAELDFNMVQSIHQRNLQDMSRWWRGTGLANNLSFARNRLMECVIWTVGIIFEPQFSKCRREVTKVGSFITVIDDMYDVYGSLDELELFTDAVERWDDDAITNLPDYMKLCFRALYDTINEMANDIHKEQGVTTIPYLKKAWADLCKSFLKEAKWCYAKHMPSFNEYLENAWISSSGALILVHVYFFVHQNVITKEVLECIENYDDLLRWPSMILRLWNDLATSRAELERGKTTNSIACYMHEFGHSEEVARDHIREMIDETWKKMNKDRFADSRFPKPLVEASTNLARTAQCFYQHGDGHGSPNVKSKKIIMSLIGEPVPPKREDI